MGIKMNKDMKEKKTLSSEINNVVESQELKEPIIRKKRRMKIFSFFKNEARVQTMKYKVASQKGRVTRLSKEGQELQYLVRESFKLEEETISYKGNEYSTYSTAVIAIADKYNGTAKWGVLQTGNIVDLRAAFILNEGIKIVKKEDNADSELEWANKFLEYNDLDKEVAQEFAKEAEIEGKIALKLAIEKIKIKDEKGNEKDDYQISARYVSWTDKEYVIKTDPQDYLKYTDMTWQPKDKDKLETLKAPIFVYKKFGGRINKPNEAAPKIMKCLTQIDNLDKALRDWREINRIFSAPILGVDCEDNEGVKLSKAALADKNWKIKKVFISKAKLYYAQFDIKGVESIEKEITTLAKLVSGATGVPVHFLGFTDILKQVATAKNLMELMIAATNKERLTWIGAYEELIKKAMVMYNTKVNAQMSEGRQLDPEKIGVEIPIVTKDHWDNLEKVFLAAAIAGKITDEAFQEQIPGFDMEAERKRREENEAKANDEMMKENENLKNEMEDKKLFGKEEPNAE